VTIALETTAAALRNYSYLATSEDELQRAVADVLEWEAIAAMREYILPGTTDRPDFFVPAGGIVVECKVDGSSNDVARQLIRYAQHADVAGIVLITTRQRHRAVPRELAGVAVDVVTVYEVAL